MVQRSKNWPPSGCGSRPAHADKARPAAIAANTQLRTVVPQTPHVIIRQPQGECKSLEGQPYVGLIGKVNGARICP